jgi:dTDP-4-amino-4,6-dideoxygalactose transaminase
MRKPNPSRSLLIWPPLPLGVYFKKKADQLPFPLNQEGCRIYSLARHAIWNACQSLQLGTGDVVLAPAYHHGSEIEALMEAGLQIRYYEVNEALEPDPESLQALLTPEVCALYIIHYLGFAQDAGFWRQWCDSNNLLLIEDAAQAFLATHQGQPVGSFGHMGVFCLYKTYGIPDGGAVISTIPPAFPAAVAETGGWRAFKRHINWIAARRAEVGRIHLFFKPIVTWWNKKWHRMRGRLTIEFDMGNPASPPSTLTNYLLPKILDDTTAERRRENYRFLLKHLSDMVPAPFASVPDGASPFAFPVEVHDARNFLTQLRKSGVVGLLFWLNPHPSLPVEDFPRSKRLREGLVALPVHQELTLVDLQQIVDAVMDVRVKKEATIGALV